MRSNQGLPCHILEELFFSINGQFEFYGNYSNILRVQTFRNFTVLHVSMHYTYHNHEKKAYDQNFTLHVFNVYLEIKKSLSV